MQVLHRPRGPGGGARKSAPYSFERLLRDLEDAGLWRELATDHASALLHAIMSGRDAVWPSGGFWRADGEDLAEGDVEAWLRGMVEPLRDCGVDLVAATLSGPHDEGPDGYAVSVNGRRRALYSVAPADPAVPLTHDPWWDCTIEPAAEVNRLLRAAGGDRRIAVFWPGGNDGLSVLGPEPVLREVGAAISAAEGASAFAVPLPTS